jgi:hypothetical protein
MASFWNLTGLCNMLCPTILKLGLDLLPGDYSAMFSALEELITWRIMKLYLSNTMSPSEKSLLVKLSHLMVHIDKRTVDKESNSCKVFALTIRTTNRPPLFCTPELPYLPHLPVFSLVHLSRVQRNSDLTSWMFMQCSSLPFLIMQHSSLGSTPESPVLQRTPVSHWEECGTLGIPHLVPGNIHYGGSGIIGQQRRNTHVFHPPTLRFTSKLVPDFLIHIPWSPFFIPE